jgi:hypothetical protein
LGEKWGVDSLIYNRFHFKHFHDLAVLSAPGVYDGFEKLLPRGSKVVDVGAGSCAFAAEGIRRGWKVDACEHDSYGRSLGVKQNVPVVSFDLLSTPPAKLTGPYDMAYCFEVAEHLPEALGLALVDYLCDLSGLLVFTAAQPRQGGTGHINEQTKEYWRDVFSQRGFRLNADSTAMLSSFWKEHVDKKTPWLWQNVQIFESHK